MPRTDGQSRWTGVRVGYACDWGGSVREMNYLDLHGADGCEGSLIKHPNGNLYFSNPTHWPLRYNLDIKKSTDNGQTWKHHHTVWKKSAGYSSMRVMPGTDEIGILYDRNNKTMIIFEAQSVSFTLVDP